MKLRISRNGFGKRTFKIWKVKEGIIVNLFGISILALK